MKQQLFLDIWIYCRWCHS